MDGAEQTELERMQTESLAFRALTLAAPELERMAEQRERRQAKATATQIAGGMLFDELRRGARLRELEAERREGRQAELPPADTFPTKIKAALAGKRKGLPLCELLWDSKEQFVEWDTIGTKVWLNSKEEIANMQRAVLRLDEDLTLILGNDYRAESFRQSGARIYRRTKDGQN